MIQGGKGAQDPMGAVPLGREGTGTAQIFKYREPQSVARMILPALQKIQQTQIQQQEKTKAKNLDFLNKVQGTLGWEQQDKDALNQIRQGITQKYIELSAKGVDPFSDPQFNQTFSQGASLIQKTKQDMDTYNDIMGKITSSSFISNVDRDALEEYYNGLEKWKSEGIQRGSIPPPPTFKDKDYSMQIASKFKELEGYVRDIQIEDAQGRTTTEKVLDMDAVAAKIKGARETGGRLGEAYDMIKKTNPEEFEGVSKEEEDYIIGDILTGNKQKKWSERFESDASFSINFDGSGGGKTRGYSFQTMPVDKSVKFQKQSPKTLESGEVKSTDNIVDFQYDKNAMFKPQSFRKPLRDGNSQIVTESISPDIVYKNKDGNLVVNGIRKTQEPVQYTDEYIIQLYPDLKGNDAASKAARQDKIKELGGVYMKNVTTPIALVLTREEDKKNFYNQWWGGKTFEEITGQAATKPTNKTTPKTTTQFKGVPKGGF